MRGKCLLLMLALALPVAAQTSYGNAYDNGPNLPSTCRPTNAVGALFFKTVTDGNGAIGAYYCSAVNTWTGPLGVATPPGGSNTQLQYNNNGVFGGFAGDSGSANNFITGISSAGITKAQPAFSNLSGAATVAQMPDLTGTAGQGGFVPPYINGLGLLGSGAGAPLSANNQVRAVQFVLPFKSTISQVTVQVTTGGGVGKLMNIGIYDAAGTTLITNTGAVDANATAVRTIALSGGAVTLNPGVYWFAFTCDSSTVAFQKILMDTQPAAIMNNVVPRVGTAANASTTGVFPGSLGAITGAAINVPYAFFER